MKFKFCHISGIHSFIKRFNTKEMSAIVINSFENTNASYSLMSKHKKLGVFVNFLCYDRSKMVELFVTVRHAFSDPIIFLIHFINR